MEEAAKLEMTAEEATQIQAAITQMFAEMKLLREQRRRDRSEIERSQLQTRAMLDTISEALTELRAS
jgi:predicted RNA binding protein with dsRBD fold (UPF0201 family)